MMFWLLHKPSMEKNDWEEGMIAVATILKHRVESSRFPNTYVEVCIQPNQFNGYDRGKNCIIRANVIL